MIIGRTALSEGAALAAALTCVAASAAAQVPGVPVLQNAFSNAGLAVAANFGGSREQSFYGAAAAWGMGSEGRISLSGAAGAQRSSGVTRGAYGGRVAARLWSSSGGALGVGGFAGIGGAPRTRTSTTITNPAVITIPAGVSVGYRKGLGTSRGLSIYVSPFYRWTRTDSVAVESERAFRVSGGLDFAFSSSLGVTVGGEFGASGGSDRSRGESGTFGVAVTFAPGGRR